jgi:hypothetical protein
MKRGRIRLESGEDLRRGLAEEQREHGWKRVALAAYLADAKRHERTDYQYHSVKSFVGFRIGPTGVRNAAFQDHSSLCIAWQDGRESVVVDDDDVLIRGLINLHDALILETLLEIFTSQAAKGVALATLDSMLESLKLAVSRVKGAASTTAGLSSLLDKRRELRWRIVERVYTYARQSPVWEAIV